jgi:two-component system sensor histidine kinase BarA
VLAEYPLLVTVGVQDDAALADYRERRLGYMIFAGATSLMVLLFGAIAIRLLNGQFHIMQALRESQVRADSANRMKSEFLASMSHELRTPLNGIMGYAELLQESSSEENREFAGIMLESSQHLLELVDSILDLAKIESGKMELELHSGGRCADDRAHRSRPIDPSAAQKGLALDAGLTPDRYDSLPATHPGCPAAQQPGQQCDQVHRHRRGRRCARQ